MTAVRSYGEAGGEGAGGRGAVGPKGPDGAGRAAKVGASLGTLRPGAGRVAGRPGQSARPASTAWQGELPAYMKPGARVSHRTFGPGIVLSADAEAIRVSFAEGDKKLLTQVCVEMGLLKPIKQRVT